MSVTKQIMLFVLLLTGAAVLFGCDAKSSTMEEASSREEKAFLFRSEMAVDTGTLADVALQYYDVSKLTSISEEEQLLKYYALPTDSLDSFTVYLSSDGNCADELAVFRGKDSDAVVLLSGAVSARINDKTNSFKEINPEEYNKIENAEIITADPFIVLVICDKADVAGSAVKETLGLSQ